MNIIFCRYKNVCEYDYIDAFKKLGVNVVELNINDIRANSIEEKAEIIGDVIRKNTPIFVFSINYFPYISIVCNSLKIKYVSVSVTCPMVEIYNLTIRNECNRVFLFDYDQYLSIKDENPDGIFYLPLGTNVERLMNVTDKVEDYRYDVSFVGSLYNEKDPFIELNINEERKSYYENLMKTQIINTSSGQEHLESAISEENVEEIKKAAKGFYLSKLSVKNIDKYVAVNNYLSPHMTYIERVRTLNSIAKRFGRGCLHLFTNSNAVELEDIIVHGGVDTLNEMPKVFRQSKINLNLSTRSIITGIPQRIWDVLGAGGFLITNYQNELNKYFEIGEHLEVYKDENELLDKIEYYLQNEELREKIARKGHELVKEKHTVLNRVIEIVRAIAE